MDSEEHSDDTEPHSNNSDSELPTSNSDRDSDSDSDSGSDEEDFDQIVTEWLTTPAANEAWLATLLLDQKEWESKHSAKAKARAEGKTTAMTVPVGTQAKKKCLKLETHFEQLLPGIPNEITMDQITPKLSWRDFHNLSSVSRGWCHAIRSRQVYEARLRSHSLETLVLLNFIHSKTSSVMVVYSMRENSCYHFPIPNLDGGFPRCCQCVSLDGKLYVLGGYKHSMCPDATESRAVQVWDLFGPRQWKKCADMQKRRGDFGCGVMDGKIYVFGGTTPYGGYVYGSEVYDPKNDTWTPIEPMKCLRFGHNVAIVGEELAMHGGKVVDPNNFNHFLMEMEFDDDCEQFHKLSAESLDFYHPVKNEWRTVKHSWSYLQLDFVAQGKLHLLTSEAIRIYDVDQDAWRKLQSCSFAALQSFIPQICYNYDVHLEEYSRSSSCSFTSGPVDSLIIVPHAVVAVEDELLAIVGWSIRDEPNPYCLSGFFRSKGFGDENKDIVWEKAPMSPFHTKDRFFMCPIQL